MNDLILKGLKFMILIIILLDSIFKFNYNNILLTKI